MPISSIFLPRSTYFTHRIRDSRRMRSIDYGARIPREVRRAAGGVSRLIYISNRRKKANTCSVAFCREFWRVPRTDGSCEEDRLAATSLGNCVLKRILLTRRVHLVHLAESGSSRDPYAILTRLCAFIAAKFIDRRTFSPDCF